MSHFVVMVIGEDVNGQMEPYQENNMGDCPTEYLEFINVDDEEKEYYQTALAHNEDLNRNKLTINSFDMKRINDAKEGELLLNIKNESSLMTHVSEGDIYQLAKSIEYKDLEFYVKILEIVNEKTLTIEKLSNQEQILLKDKMSYIEYMENYCGYKYSQENEAFGYYENKNAKWDWWVLGGRWSGFLKLKKDFELTSVRTSDGHPISNELIKDLRVDSAQVKAIDFEYMVNEARDAAQKDYEIAEKIFKGNIPSVKIKWEEFVQEIINNNMSRDEAIEKYNTQVEVATAKEVISSISNEELIECGVSEKVGSFYKHQFQIEKYAKTKEEVVNQAGRSALSTHSIVKDSKWYQKGQMGWFGVSLDNKDQDDWDVEFAKLIAELDPEEWISIIDCHI